MKIAKDEFNSKIFKQNMGNITYDGDVDVKKIIDEAIQEGYHHLSVKVDTFDLSVVNEFIRNGFSIVDTLISYRFDYRTTTIIDCEYISDISIDSVKPSEIEDIARIAHDSFFNDRFHNDVTLDNNLCNLYYENWARNCCNGYADLALICKSKDGKILGFMTSRNIDKNESNLVISAVTKESRGKGVYSAFAWESMKYFKNKSNYITTGTQINNYAVQKTWGKLGFKVYDSKYVLHLGVL